MDFNIPSGLAKETLKLAAEQGDIDLMFNSGVVEGVVTGAVEGTLSPRHALEQLLINTSLQLIEEPGSGAFAVIKKVRSSSQEVVKDSQDNDETTNPKMKTQKSKTGNLLKGIMALFVSTAPLAANAQDDASYNEEDIYVLSPFEITTDEDVGYLATSSLAGTRIKADLSDIGSAISVYTEEFMEDIDAVDSETLLAYSLGTEVGGFRGNFVNSDSFGIENENIDQPHRNTRVRGLTSADNTANYFKTDVPWDGYNTGRVDIQRGANSILFGLGSPAGIINTTVNSAEFRDGGKAKVRIDEHGSTRVELDYNHQIIDDELAVRISLLQDNQKYQQDPAYEDDKRFFGAFQYKPAALNKGSTLFKIKGHFEHGEIKSNRPRMVAPLDHISPWLQTGNGFGPGFEHYGDADWALGGRLVDQINENGINAAPRDHYNPWISGTSSLVPAVFYNPDGSSFISEQGVNSRGSWFWDDYMTDLGYEGAIVNDGTVPASNGSVNNEVNGTVRSVMRMTINGKERVASDTAMPFQGFWKDSSFMDTTYFDFYNNLIDGDSKLETKDWDVYELELNNTFFNNKMGYNIAFYKQTYESTFDAMLGNVFAPTITVDVGMWDFTSTPENLMANPYGGSAVVHSDNPGGRWSKNERDSLRFQAFYSHDFAEKKDTLLARILGKHDFVAVAQKRNWDKESLSHAAVAPDPTYIYGRGQDIKPDLALPAGSKNAEYEINFHGMRPPTRYYLGGNGLYDLQPVSVGLDDLPSGMIAVQGFDATPLAGITSGYAAGFWSDPWSIAESADPTAGSNQSRNPDNYAGWKATDLGAHQFYRWGDSEEANDYLTQSEGIFTEEVESKAAVWTGRWWEGAIVGMFGWREDKVKETWVTHEYRNDGPVFDRSVNGRESRSTTTESKNWSVKANLTHLTGLHRSLPFDVHVLYAEGEVQTPDPSRVDVFNTPLDNAEGSTEEASLMLTDANGKWSFRVTKYETSVKNAVSQSKIAQNNWRLEQTLSFGVRAVQNIEQGRSNYTASWLALSPEAEAAGYATEAEYHQNAVAPAFREFEQALWEQFPETEGWFTNADQYQPGGASNFPQVQFPDNAVMVEDQISKGYEIEFTANPLPNWNIAINASKTEAIRDNLPGDKFGAVLDLFAEYLAGPAGDANVWWFEGPKTRDHYAPFEGELIKAQALNGATQPEVREWKVNLITNYSFKEGKLDGLGIGGAYRYESDMIISYNPSLDAEGNTVIDLDNNFRDDARHTVDLWASYGRPISDDVDWKIQLNIFNAFGDNELIPLHVNPDGSYGHMGIREGMSWAITNTFSF